MGRNYRGLLLGLACAVGLLLTASRLALADTAANAMQVVAWAQQHASAYGMDPQPLARALLASGFYESGLQDIPNANHSGAQGPFQFYGPTLATAEARGFNIHTVAGALDAFAASGDLWLGVQAYNAARAVGADDTVALHAFYLAMERPGAGEDAVRYAHGDWAAAVAFAYSVGGMAPATAPTPSPTADLSTALSGVAAAASRAAAAGGASQTQWPSGAVGPPGRFVGDAMIDANGVLYIWDGSIWVAAAQGRPIAATS